MKLYISPNLSKDRYIKTSLECIEQLISNGFECYTSEQDSVALYGDKRIAADADICDVIVSIGGDGSVLKASHIAIKHNKALFGINGGRLGYLCAFETSELKDLTKNDIEALVLSERSIITDGNGHIAFNDIVVAKSDFGSILSFTVLCNGNEISSFRGDGVIISTPTGSSSYNMSANGPLLLPECECLSITPICPHLSCIGSIVAPDSCNITVKLADDSQSKAVTYYDGIPIQMSSPSLTVKRYESKLSLLVKKENTSVNAQKLRK